MLPLPFAYDASRCETAFPRKNRRALGPRNLFAFTDPAISFCFSNRRLWRLQHTYTLIHLGRSVVVQIESRKRGLSTQTRQLLAACLPKSAKQVRFNRLAAIRRRMFATVPASSGQRTSVGAGRGPDIRFARQRRRNVFDERKPAVVQNTRSSSGRRRQRRWRRWPTKRDSAPVVPGSQRHALGNRSPNGNRTEGRDGLGTRSRG